MGHRTYGVALVAALTVALGLASVQSNSAPAAGAPAGPDGRADVVAGQQRLAADAVGDLRLTRGPDGVADFASAATGELSNPGVTRRTSVRAAADAHLARYGAAFGLSRSGTTLEYAGRGATGSREDLVRYDQRVDGVPVIGGGVVVALRPDRQLGSLLSTVSGASSLPAATVDEDAAAATARESVAAGTGLDPADLPVERRGRWVWDPEVLGAASPVGARAVWRFDVGDGATALHTVLVDDRTGTVLLDADNLQSALDRVVCDKNNAVSASTPCTSGFARTEASGPSGITDVNQAFDHAGEVSAFYQDVAGVDLTQLLGVSVGGVPKLAATTRFCREIVDCPMANAFWNGTQMFYGQGFAAADDVVGHEMTHGVISRNSDLFYWGQSGAINESLADIMGEIVDHRNTLVAGDASWPLGEDAPGGALRNMSSPTSLGQPDRMTSGLWDADTFGYGDNGGVHTNSGVGNKTAYLISQGGTFNGQTITGIDGGDTTLSKTAALYYEVIVRLTSGSDYANLADVLEQTCADFVAAPNAHGFNAGDCTNVSKAVLATQLRTTPTNAPQPPDAARTCPTGSLRVLFDGETGNPAASFTAGNLWFRLTDGDAGGNATSGHTSWFGDDPGSTQSSPLTLATPVTLPAGQPTYLWFQQWRLLGYSGSTFYDGGTVELDNTADAVGAYRGEDFSWVNGPTQNLAGSHAGRRGFGSDSFGWVASRLDLSAFNGSPVRPSFTLRSQVGGIGWFLDDVVVYTCDGGTITAPPLPPPPTTPPTPTAPTPTSPISPAAAGVAVRGALGKAVVTWKTPVAGDSAVSAWRVFTTGITTNLPAGARSTTLKGLKQATTYPITVVPIVSAGQPGTPVTVKALGTKTSLVVRLAGGKTKLSGKLTAAGAGVRGAVLKLLMKKSGTWVKVTTTKTGKGGSYVVRVAGTKRRTFRAVYAGGAGLMGNRSPQRHR